MYFLYTVNAAGERVGYDAENHQTMFFSSSNSGSTPDATYQYDGEGKRVKKISSTETTIFVYDGGGQLVAEYSAALASTQQVSYLTQDHLGSARVISNEIGTVTNRKDFAAFGDQVTSAQRVSGSSGNGYDPASTREDYTGYEKDGESGLEFAQARYYNPTHGRYTSIDPMTASATIKNPQTFNRYSYVLNSPYKLVDPLGMISETTGACGSRCSNSDGGSVGLIGLTAGMGDEQVKRVKIQNRQSALPPVSPPPPATGGGPTPPKINPIPVTYDVHGGTAKDAAKDALRQAAKKGLKKGAAGQTQMVIAGMQPFRDSDFRVTSYSEDKATGIWTVTVISIDAAVVADVITTLPNWVDRGSASVSEQKLSDSYFAQIAIFKGEHTMDITKRLYQFRDGLIGLTATAAGPTKDAAIRNTIPTFMTHLANGIKTLTTNYTADAAIRHANNGHIFVVK